VLVRRDRLRTPDQLEQINGMLQQAAIDARQALDWVETRPELEAGAIGVFGVSMGGIRAAFLTPLDRRIRASVIGLAGGDLPHILTYSCEPGLSRRRGAYLKAHQISLEEFHEGLKPVMTCDPLNVAPCVDPRKVLLVLGICDTAVPTKKGFELRKAMGKPETIIVPTGHYTALLYVPYIKAAALRFFHEKLGREWSARREERAGE
jgi:cephalosporin-C deacetylase-like acetyl esterase